jgi:hypothetical protein
MLSRACYAGSPCGLGEARAPRANALIKRFECLSYLQQEWCLRPAGIRQRLTTAILCFFD